MNSLERAFTPPKIALSRCLEELLYTPRSSYYRSIIRASRALLPEVSDKSLKSTRNGAFPPFGLIKQPELPLSFFWMVCNICRYIQTKQSGGFLKSGGVFLERRCSLDWGEPVRSDALQRPQHTLSLSLSFSLTSLPSRNPPSSALMTESQPSMLKNQQDHVCEY